MNLLSMLLSLGQPRLQQRDQPVAAPNKQLATLVLHVRLSAAVITCNARAELLQDLILTKNRVAKKMRTYFEMGTDGHRFLCFQFGIS